MSVSEKMTAIADGIRKYTGDTEKLTLDEIAESIPQVREAGRKSGYSSGYNAGRTKGKEEGIEVGKEEERANFWTGFIYDKYDDFKYAFYKMSDVTYHPHIVPSPRNADYMYASSKMTEIVVDMSNTTTATAVFAASRATNITITSTETTAWNTGMFSGRQANMQTNLTVNGVIAKAFSVSSLLLLHDSIISIINALKDFSGETGETGYKATLGSANLNRLSDEEKARITAKGWTYA